MLISCKEPVLTSNMTNRGLRRFTVGFISCVDTNAVNEIEAHLITTSVFSIEITPRKSQSKK